MQWSRSPSVVAITTQITQVVAQNTRLSMLNLDVREALIHAQKASAFEWLRTVSLDGRVVPLDAPHIGRLNCYFVLCCCSCLPENVAQVPGEIGHLVPIGADDEQVLFRLLPDIPECLWTITPLDTRTVAVPQVFDRALAGGVPKPDVWPARRKPRDLVAKHKVVSAARNAKKACMTKEKPQDKQRTSGILLSPFNGSDLASVPGGFGVWGGIIDFADEPDSLWSLQVCKITSISKAKNDQGDETLRCRVVLAQPGTTKEFIKFRFDAAALSDKIETACVKDFLVFFPSFNGNKIPVKVTQPYLFCWTCVNRCLLC